MLAAMTGMLAAAWVLYSAEQTGLPLEDSAPFLAVTAVVAIFGFLRLFSGEGAEAQLDSARVDKRLGLLGERLKRLDLLRTLDPPKQRHDGRAENAFAPFGKHPEAAH
jgi:hypothetical protein